MKSIKTLIQVHLNPGGAIRWLFPHRRVARIMNVRIANLLFGCLAVFGTLHAGLMDPFVGFETYRDLAENRGRFSAGATQVPIFNQYTGELIGILPAVPNFDALNDLGNGALVAHPSFFASCAHCSQSQFTFTRRFQRKGICPKPFLDTYRVVAHNNFQDHASVNIDYKFSRLNKMVTEAEPYIYSRPGPEDDPQTFYETLAKSSFNFRIGGGYNRYALHEGFLAPDARQELNGNTQIIGRAGITAGTFRFRHITPFDDSSDGPHRGTFYFAYDMEAANAVNPMPNGTMQGDSGSPVLVYNSKARRFEFFGAHIASIGGGHGFDSFSWARHSPTWSLELLDSYERRISPLCSAPMLWTWDESGIGRFVQDGDILTTVQGLPVTVHGATSTVAADGHSTVSAGDEEMNASNNLRFDGEKITITLSEPMDMGAGTLTFEADTTLKGARLNSAGFIVADTKTVTTELTGVPGDEWRKVGAGTLVIRGAGENPARLNTGGGGLTLLKREEGSAVSHVKISGGTATTVRLDRENQIAGANGSPETVVFGHGGGSLDLYGQSASWEGITHLDRGARLVNTHPSHGSVFTFTGSGEHVYLGGFSDSGTEGGGRLEVRYDGGSGSIWRLHGKHTNQGRWTVSSGTVEIVGRPTPLATRETSGGWYHESWLENQRFDEQNWEAASLDTGELHIAGGGKVRIGKAASVRADVRVEKEGILSLESSDAEFTGNVTLLGPESRFDITTAVGENTRFHGKLRGSGQILKDGAGTFSLHAESHFDIADIREGRLRISGSGGLHGDVILAENTILDVSGVDDAEVIMTGILRMKKGATLNLGEKRMAVDELWIDGIQQPSRIYSATSDFLAGPGALQVVNGPCSVDDDAAAEWILPGEKRAYVISRLGMVKEISLPKLTARQKSAVGLWRTVISLDLYGVKDGRECRDYGGGDGSGFGQRSRGGHETTPHMGGPYMEGTHLLNAACALVLHAPGPSLILTGRKL